MTKMIGIISKGLLVILSVWFLFAQTFVLAEENNSSNRSMGEILATIEAYEKSSFAAERGEQFTISVKIATPEKIKSIAIEIYSGDGDLVRTLMPISVKSDKSHYDMVWDGKDSDKQIVPDEAYHPVLLITDNKKNIERIDYRVQSGGEEVYDFEKAIRTGQIEYTLPVASRVLIRSGIKNGPMLRTVVDWQPRAAGFHAERWNGRDLDNVIAIEQNSQVGYLILGYQLPERSIITYGNTRESYRSYHERKKWPLKQASFTGRLLERGGKVIRPESYTPILQQKSPRITVSLLDKTTRKPLTEVIGFDEWITEVNLHPADEIYLDQERYEISFFVDNEFISEEEQGFVPYTWRWSPGRLGIKPGEHVLTVNVSGYNGQVGVKNIAFTAKQENGLGATTAAPPSMEIQAK